MNSSQKDRAHDSCIEERLFVVPIPRHPIVDSQLVRPDWNASAPRDQRLLWLDKNENTDPEFAGLAKQVLSEISPTVLSTYPECAPLYRKLAAYVGVPPDCLLLTAGADGVIRAIFEAFVREGDAVVHTQPTFAMYGVYCRMFGAKSVVAEYNPSDVGPYLSSGTVIDTVRRARPRLVCLPNPDSPTGTIFSPAELRSIIEVAGEVGALVLIDEAYHPFYDWTAVSWIEEYPHLVIARTCSKAWGLAGLRIGYSVSCIDTARLLRKVRPLYEVNNVAILVMERMLDYSAAMLASVHRLNAGRDAFLADMRDLGFRTVHAKGNFLHVAFGDKALPVHAALASIVLYRHDHDVSCLAGFSRFSATTSDRFRPIVEAIRQVVAAPTAGFVSIGSSK